MDAYWGTTPRDWEECTLDQIYIAMAPMDDLQSRWGGVVNLTPSQARSRGVIPEGVKLYEGGLSYVGRLKAARAEKEREAKEAERAEGRRRRAERRKKKGEGGGR